MVIKRVPVTDYDNTGKEKSEVDHSDFYRRWYAKFGKPQTITLPGDEFMKRLKEMIEFE